MKSSTLVLSLFLSLILFTACNNSHTIAELFEKEGCSGPCYQRMPCEGERISVTFKLTGSNVLQNGHMYFVRDDEDMNKTIKIEFDKSIPAEIQEQLVNNEGKTATISGHLEGYDLMSPQSCRRAHIIYVSNPEDVSLE